MTIVIKPSKDKKRGYYYFQHSVWNSAKGKVETKSHYLSPVSPRRKKSNFGQLIAGGLSLAMGGGTTYSKKETIRAPDRRGAWIPDRIPVIQAKAAKHVPTVLTDEQKADLAAFKASLERHAISPDKAPQSAQAATPSSASPSDAPPSTGEQSSPSSQGSESFDTPA